MGKYVLHMDDDYRQVIIIDKYCNGKSFGVSDLTPYTEPDLEQVRKEAYEKGLADAWEAARKISMAEINGRCSWKSMKNIFGIDIPSKIFKNFTASESIEKLKAYEQEQGAEIKVGDEVENTKTGVKFIVTHLWENNRGEQGVSGFNQECSAFSTTLSLVVKTGRHFPEIVAVLAKMKEN